MLRRTIGDHVTPQRRAFVRSFARAQDRSHELPAAPLPTHSRREWSPFSSPEPLPAASRSPFSLFQRVDIRHLPLFGSLDQHEISNRKMNATLFDD
jgi:hypothetical protein